MENSKTKKAIVAQTVIAFVLCLILLVLIIFQFSSIIQLRQEQATLDRQLQDLVNNNSEYSDQLDYYLSDDYLEDIAHEHNKYKPGVDYYG